MKIYVFNLNCFVSSPSENAKHGNYNTGIRSLQNVNSFSYNELKLATGGFHVLNKIGKGGFGDVYKGRLSDGKRVAVKVLSLGSKQGDREFMCEIGSMSNIRHDNIVNLHGGCIHGPTRILVYDLMENNNLAHILHGGRSKFRWQLRKQVILGISQGLEYIHEKIKPHIVHRDIKPTNILLDHNFTPKISDFGLSKLFSDNITQISTRVAGTLGYLAPEYAISGHLTRKSDVYSFGVLLLEIVTGRKSIDFDPNIGEYFLLEKTWEMFKCNKLVNLVDPKLNGEVSEIEAIRFIKVGLLCTQEKSRLRPKMSTAIKMMNDEINIDGLDIQRPGLVHNIMDVKITPKNSSKIVKRRRTHPCNL